MPSKEELKNEILKMTDDIDKMNQQDIHTLDVCLHGLDTELTEHGLIVIGRCIQIVRNRLSGYTEEELEWFDRYNNLK